MYSRFLPSRLGRRGSTRRAGFDGNLATLFPGAYQVLQSDRGLTYGGTPLATAGNTSTTVVTLTGSLATPPVPIRVTCIAAGTIGDLVSEFAISLDGGLTISQVITAPAVGVPVALTGAAAGLLVAFSAGACVLNDTWKATCSALADQSGNGFNVIQAGATLQAIVGIGLNGKASLLFDGVDDYMRCAAFTPAAGFMRYAVLRLVTHVNFCGIADSGPGNLALLSMNNTGAGSLRIYNGAALAGGILPVGSPGRVACVYNGASSAIQVGNLAPVNGNSGAFALVADLCVGCRGDLALFSNFELFALVHAPEGSYAAADAAINSSGGYGPGAIGV